MVEKNKISPLANISAAREIIAAYNLHAKKSFGQNFLINDEIVKKILNLAKVEQGEYVTEIGPGYGTLTVALARTGANILAVEKDKKMINILAENLEKYCPEHIENIKLLRQDALKINFEAYKNVLKDNEVKLVSNLPYNVAAPVVITYFQKLSNLSQATVMVQKEIADRMCANPGSKNYGAYTVKLAMYAKQNGKFSVSPNNFMPAPRVESTVIKLIRHNDIDSLTASRACMIADAAFAHRRKTIANSIKEYFSNDTFMQNKIRKAFELSDLYLTDRAEKLWPSDYAKVAKNLI